MLVSRVQTGSNAWPNGGKISPFIGYNSGATQADIDNPGYQRKLAMIHKASEVVMVVEAANNNWMDQGSAGSLNRLGGRHGKKSADGRQAYTNFAFFDGHVGLFPTADYDKKAPAGTPGAASGGDNMLVAMYTNTVFYLNKQRGR
jgi:prepilin-type processing-associated H-X9-DG protein